MTLEKTNIETRRKVFWYLWCTQCASLVNMATIERASSLTGLSIEMLTERLNRHSIHYMKKQSGNLLICLESLLSNTRMK